MDLILCATTAHKTNLNNMYPNLSEKIYTMKEYAEYNETNLDIRDPWACGIGAYRICVAELEKCLEKTCQKLFSDIQ